MSTIISENVETHVGRLKWALTGTKVYTFTIIRKTISLTESINDI